MKLYNLSRIVFFTVFISLSFTLHAQSNNQKSVLLVYGGWDGHNPEGFKNLFLPWLEDQGFDVTVSNSLDIYANSIKMATFDLIVQAWTMGELTKEQSKGLLTAVANGAGLAGCHGGITDAFRCNLEYLNVVGGQFLSHPGGSIEYEVNFNDVSDPITKGLSDFTIKSEQYYMAMNPGVTVLATTTFTGDHAEWSRDVVMPVVWKRTWGKGKVFVNALGHSMDEYEIEQVMEVTMRGFNWAIRD